MDYMASQTSSTLPAGIHNLSLVDFRVPQSFSPLANILHRTFIRACHVEFLGNGQVILHVTVDQNVADHEAQRAWCGCTIQMASVPGLTPTDGLAAEARMALVDYRTPHPDA